MSGLTFIILFSLAFLTGPICVAVYCHFGLKKQYSESQFTKLLDHIKAYNTTETLIDSESITPDDIVDILKEDRRFYDIKTETYSDENATKTTIYFGYRNQGFVIVHTKNKFYGGHITVSKHHSVKKNALGVQHERYDEHIQTLKKFLLGHD